MADRPIQRRLSAVLAADVVGYTHHMERDTEGTVAAWQAAREEVINPTIAAYSGKIVKLTGDGFLTEFSTVLDAVNCAVNMQLNLAPSNLEFRMGINLGDVVDDGEDIHGEGVNIAARIEALADPGGISVSASVYDQVRNRVDYRFEDFGEHRVKHVSTPIQIWRWSSGTQSSFVKSEIESEEVLPLPDKPSIAVLPFDNIGGDPEQEYFSDGITEDIITELSKISGIFVIGRHSAFVYKDQQLALKQIGRELGVRYVLEGSIRKAGNRIRVSTQVIDSSSNHCLWAERYDRELEDIFEVQDEVARNVAKALEVVLTPGEGDRISRPPTANIEAYDTFLRTRSSLWPPTRENLLIARSAYSRITEMDPEFAGGPTGQSLTRSLTVVFGLSENPQEDLRLGLELAKAALAIDDSFAQAHSALGIALIATGQFDEGVSRTRQAVELQPGDADVLLFSALASLFAGEFEDAYATINIAIRLDPQYVRGPYLNVLGIICFCANRYQESIDVFNRNVNRGGPIGPPALAFRTAAYNAAGEVEAAKTSAKELHSLFPAFSLAGFRMPYMLKNADDTEQVIGALRKLGLPE